MNVFSADCLQGGNFLVTGASSGLGYETAKLIAACGGTVVATGRDVTRLENLKSELRAGVEHVIAPVEMKDADQVAVWTKSISENHGPFMGVFHAAGVELTKPVRLMKQAQLDEFFSSSLYAAFGIARAASQKGVLVDGASILFMSSVAGLRGTPGLTTYSAAKAGIDGLMRSLACELAGRKIRVNSVAAGAVETAMHARHVAAIGINATEIYRARHPLGFGIPMDVANIAVFLMSPAARWITGACIPVDGGYTAQ